ncbi:MAG: thioredoxin-disulfide reductase [Clostridiales bacterium]|nr:thioredoxin-disulfide reductase [Clostridiales bacterium]
MDFDVIIIGAGPAGLSAGIYCGRAGLSTLVLAPQGTGGQVSYTNEIENYPGFAGTGAELSEKMYEQAVQSGAVFAGEKAQELKSVQGAWSVRTRRGEYRAKKVIIATGADPRKLGADGEERFKGAGVSYCATCDGAFFKDKTVMVVGGGNTAFSDALYLSRFCRRVYLVHRNEKFRASRVLIDRVRRSSKILIRTNETVEKIQGEASVKSVVLKHTLSSRMSVIETDAVFAAVGRVPQSELVSGIAELTDEGYIVTDDRMHTDKEGLYAVGDVRKTPLRQIVTAAADGAVAAEDIANSL